MVLARLRTVRFAWSCSPALSFNVRIQQPADHALVLGLMFGRLSDLKKSTLLLLRASVTFTPVFL